MANNAVLQKGFELPNKTYKENTLDIPESNWISLFIMILLWTFGTIIISILSNILFPKFYNLKYKYLYLIEIILQLIFISILLFLYQTHIFYPIISFIHNNKYHSFHTDSIITATTVGVSLGLNMKSLLLKILHTSSF
tara:strand:+ start:78 stop:491 length:414 start_codon:yes stop_codon:yes gene_type:complete